MLFYFLEVSIFKKYKVLHTSDLKRLLAVIIHKCVNCVTILKNCVTLSEV